eukprot:jgi/Mesen1/9850/ME000070S09134
MEVIQNKEQMRSWSRQQRKEGKRIGFVPTMGYLHEGHLSLIQEARQRADVIVVSIYVNPGQFGPREDFSIYPRDLEGDLQKLKSLNVEATFCPADLYVRDTASPGSHSSSSAPPGGRRPDDHSTPEAPGGDVSATPASQVADVGPTGHETWVQVERLQRPLCGRSRPAFFRGVATVVAKLFNIVEPDVALFGKKDYQQWRILMRMARDLDFGVEVVGVPLMRESDGLALSSRNVRLSPEERRQALSISRSLREAEAMAGSSEAGGGEARAEVLVAHVRSAIEAAGGLVDYVEVHAVLPPPLVTRLQLVHQETLEPLATLAAPGVLVVAAHFGSVRLLDNMELPLRPPPGGLAQPST